MSPRETSILVTNTGTADVTVGVFDPIGGGMLSPSGHSYKGLGMICARPLSLFLKPGVTRSIALSVTVLTSGVVVLPLNLRLLGTKGGIVKEWQYLVQAEGEEPLISDRVLSIIENERLLCLLPVQSNDGEVEFQKLLEPRRVPTINDLYVMKGLLAPVRPMVWDGEFVFVFLFFCFFVFFLFFVFVFVFSFFVFSFFFLVLELTQIVVMFFSIFFHFPSTHAHAHISLIYSHNNTYHWILQVHIK